MDLIVLVEAGGGIYGEINYEFVELIPFMTRYNTTQVLQRSVAGCGCD